jgi:hypothetical protein
MVQFQIVTRQMTVLVAHRFQSRLPFLDQQPFEAGKFAIIHGVLAPVPDLCENAL